MPQQPQPQGRIDVHHHFNAPGGRGGQSSWSPERAIDEMDANGVASAIGWPGPVAAPDAAGARRRAREINEFSAGLVRRYPQRFGLFASLPPLHDTDGALLALCHAFDELGADGIGLVTHYGNAWLGDPAFHPVLEELNRRKAVVFVHPQAGNGCDCGRLGYMTAPITDSWLEYTFNTARTILSLAATGSLRQFSDIRFIFCHGGGAFTSLVSRIEAFTGWFDMGPEKLEALFPQGLQAEFARLHFECAQAYTAPQIAQLRALVPDSQLLFGTDFDRFSIAHSVQRLNALDLPQATRAALESGNARRLFSRWRGG